MDPEPTIYLRSAADLFCNLKDKDIPEELADDPEPEPNPYAPHMLGRKPTVYSPPPPEDYTPDVDAIPSAEVEQMNSEFNAHLSRQGNSAAPAKSDAEAAAPKPKPFAEDKVTVDAKSPEEWADEKMVIKNADEGDAQSEFFKHLRRQKAEENDEADGDGSVASEEEIRKHQEKVRKAKEKSKGDESIDETTGPGEDGAERGPGW